MLCCAQSLSHIRPFATPWTVAHQSPLSMEFSRQEYWKGCHILLQGVFLTQGSNPHRPHCRQTLYLLSHWGSPVFLILHIFKITGFPGGSVVKNSPAKACRSPTPATRDSTWGDDGVGQWDSLSVFYGLPVYSKFKILFYTLTKTLGQRFDIFSSPSPRFIISINHCCSSNRVPASVILSESALSSIIYLL